MKRSLDFGGDFVCYVTKSSSCNDTINNSIKKPNRRSAEACKIKNEGTILHLMIDKLLDFLEYFIRGKVNFLKKSIEMMAFGVVTSIVEEATIKRKKISDTTKTFIVSVLANHDVETIPNAVV